MSTKARAVLIYILLSKYKTPPSALESLGATAVPEKLRMRVHTLNISVVTDSRRVNRV